MRDLEAALAAILACFRTGRARSLSALFRPRIDRILFAATKADHLHHASHDRLEAILVAHDRARDRAARSSPAPRRRRRARRRARDARGDGDARARRAARDHRHAAARAKRSAGESFDGETEVAVFPGDLPDDPAALFANGFRRPDRSGDETDYRFLRFRPPPIEPGETASPTLPHIRLDRALQFLIGDRLA